MCAFPYTFESNFEGGTSAEWDTETDTTSILDFPHYTELARWPWSECAPYRGAYCMRLNVGGVTADATLTEGDCDLAAGATGWYRFYLYFGDNFTATANDTFALLELQQAAGTVEVSFGARVVASTNAINLGIGELAPTSFSDAPLTRNKWHLVEVKAVCDSGPNDGTIDLYVDGSLEASVTSLDQGTIGQAVLGIQDELATTSGMILIDSFVQDETQLGGFSDANKSSFTITKTGHLFVGPGRLAELDLVSGNGTDNVITLYDTDTASALGDTPIIIRLNNTVAYEFVPSGPLDYRRFTKGCYAVMSGTNPRGIVNICNAPTLFSRNVLRQYVRGSN